MIRTSNLLLAVLAALTLISSACAPSKPAEEDTQAEVGATARVAQVQTITVRPREVTQTVDLAIDLRPARRATLAAEIAGNIEAVEFDLGDAVRAGQLMARIDTRSIQTEVAQAKALYDQAVDEANRAESLFARHSITRDRLISAQTNRDVAKSRLDSAKIRLAQSQVRAPWSGHVAARRVERGDYVDVGQALFELVDSDPLKVHASVPADNVPFLKVGEEAAVEVDAVPGRTFTARVTRLGAELDTASRTLELEARLPNSEGALKPGMYGRMHLPLRTLDAALVVPLSALVDFESGKVLYVVEAGHAARRHIVTGPVLGDEVVIEKGLEPDAAVIVAGQDQVADGQQVEIQPEASQPDETEPDAAQPAEPS
jgi:RND family efflux transporter MFP subunit